MCLDFRFSKMKILTWAGEDVQMRAIKIKFRCDVSLDQLPKKLQRRKERASLCRSENARDFLLIQWLARTIVPQTTVAVVSAITRKMSTNSLKMTCIKR